jgi:hypothetical protein
MKELGYGEEYNMPMITTIILLNKNFTRSFKKTLIIPGNNSRETNQRI